MNLKKLVFYALVAVATFLAGLSFALAAMFVEHVLTAEEEEPHCTAELAPPREAPPPPPSMPTTPPVVAAPEGPSEICDADLNQGDFAFVETPPKAFRAINYIYIERSVWNDKRRQYVRVTPNGSVMDDDEKRMAELTFDGDRMKFRTRERKGVSYRFDGRFVDETIKVKSDGETYDSTVHLKGRLSKWKNGAKIADAFVRLNQDCGC